MCSMKKWQTDVKYTLSNQEKGSKFFIIFNETEFTHNNTHN